MFLDLRKLFRPDAEVVEGSTAFDFSAEDFVGYQVPGPVQFGWRAVPTGSLVRLWLTMDAQLHAACARCLAPVVQDIRIEKDYAIDEDAVREEYPELPIVAGGQLDLQELAYGELVIEAPPVLLCSEDCPGLCARCGRPAVACDCDAQPEGDPRLQVLKTLLTEDDDA